MADFLVPEGFAGPRGLRALAGEVSVVLEAARFHRRASAARVTAWSNALAGRTTRTAPGDPVLLVPGFLAGDYTLSGMGGYLRGLGHRVYRTGIIANVGCVERGTGVLERRLEHIAERRQRKVTIVGHSLGGLMARGLAARRSDLVDGIVTLGSPMLAPGATHPVLLFDLMVLNRLQRVGMKVMGEDCTSGDCARSSWEQARAPLARGVAFTSVYSRRDGIVDWRSCLDPQARAVEVGTSHLGMAFDPAVLDVVVDTLAENRARHLRRRRRELSRQARLAAVPDASAG
jgi:pimeloyl-ACP methyl ester carboxylesterase